MALVVVLWVIVLLSIMAAAHSSNVHTTTQLTATQLELAQLQMRAHSGVQRAILDLLARGNPAPLPINGKLRSVTIMGKPVAVSIRSASGLLDLNSATPQLLSSLLDITNAEPGTKAELVDAILDWRDADDLTRLHGAEKDRYASQPGGWTIRNGAFLSVDELRYVHGMTNHYFQQIAPLVTVHSGRAGVDFEYAPPALIRVLTGARVASTDEVQPGTSRANPSPGSRAGTFHIDVAATSPTARATLQAVVRISPAAAPPYTVLQWREPARSLPGVLR